MRERPVSSDVAPPREGSYPTGGGTGSPGAAGTPGSPDNVVPFPGPARNGAAADGAATDATGSTFGLSGPPTGRRVRARLARLNVPWQTEQISEVLEPLIAMHRATHRKADIRPLQKAYDAATRWHEGQYRKSGDPYITHPLAVATLLAELGMDTTALAAALLHDTIENSEYPLDQLQADFGDEIALLVDGVTKLDKVKLGEAAAAETIRKLVVASARDPRVLVIELACRLHNMRSLTFLPRGIGRA